jgi:hypothetical protein
MKAFLQEMDTEGEADRRRTGTEMKEEAERGRRFSRDWMMFVVLYQYIEHGLSWSVYDAWYLVELDGTDYEVCLTSAPSTGFSHFSISLANIYELGAGILPTGNNPAISSWPVS